MAEDICVAVGKRIRKLRKERGWRQIDLAQHSGVHEVHISYLERGVREVGLRHLDAIAGGFGMSLEQFFAGVQSERKAL